MKKVRYIKSESPLIVQKRAFCVEIVSLAHGILASRSHILKKFRGKKRYFRNLWEEVNTFDLQLEHDSCVYFWHTHLDFFGVGKIRREHIKAFKDLIVLHQFDISYDQSECEEVYYIQSKEQGIRV